MTVMWVAVAVAVVLLISTWVGRRCGEWLAGRGAEWDEMTRLERARKTTGDPT